MMTAAYLPDTLQCQVTRIGLAQLGEQPETLSGRGECKVNRKSRQWIICTRLFDVFSDQRLFGLFIFLDNRGRLCHWVARMLSCFSSHWNRAYLHCPRKTSFTMSGESYFHPPHITHHLFVLHYSDCLLLSPHRGHIHYNYLIES